MVAIQHGMDLCFTLGLSNVSFFSDSLEAVRVVLNPDNRFGQASVLKPKLRSMLASNIFTSIHHVGRTTNGAAHLLACKAVVVNRDVSHYLLCRFLFKKELKKNRQNLFVLFNDIPPHWSLSYSGVVPEFEILMG